MATLTQYKTLLFDIQKTHQETTVKLTKTQMGKFTLNNLF